MRVCVFVCSAEDVQSIVTGKLALKYAGVQIQAIQSIAKASQNRSVAEFEKVRQTVCHLTGGRNCFILLQTVSEQREYVEGDPIVKVSTYYFFS